jgi:AbrB family looped-hinge helix DNA binding protein
MRVVYRSSVLGLEIRGGNNGSKNPHSIKLTSDSESRKPINSAGRIVVPKAMRQALEIEAGPTLDIRVTGDGRRLEIEIAPTRCI